MWVGKHTQCVCCLYGCLERAQRMWIDHISCLLSSLLISQAGNPQIPALGPADWQASL